MQVIPTDSIHIVLDVDAEVCRLGYGDKDFKGMGILQAAALCRGLTVNHHPGIRIGLLIADDLTLVYSPTPELIETESRQPDKPNAICLRSAVPPQLASACAIGAEGFLNLEVGHEPVEQKKIETVKRELAERPPKPFNVARIERVFNSMLHFVELRIKARFIMEAGDFGLVILRKDVADFQQELELLKIKIAAYKEAVQGIIENRTDEIVAELLAALKETLRANPPEHWRSHFLGKEPSDADVQRLFENEIRSEVKRVKTDFDPRVFHAFKDVTYQTFHDKGFRQLLENRFGTDAIARLFSEHDVAPEKNMVSSPE